MSSLAERSRGVFSQAGWAAREIKTLREDNEKLRKLYAAQQLQIVALKIQVQHEMQLARDRARAKRKSARDA